MILQTSKLTKKYRRITAANELDIEIKQGQVFGMLGPNGSGKTTTLGMILGVINKTSGSFSWFGRGEGHEARKNIGAILEHPIFYPFLTAVQNLKITAEIKEIKNPDFDGMLKLVGLYDRRNDPFKTYSLGMKQRLAIAASMLANPDVLIFDEPTNGLDPQGIAEIRQIIADISQMDKTIIMASHLLDEVQKVCSHFMVLRQGKHIFTGSVEEVLNQKVRIEMASDNLQELKNILSDEARIVGLEEKPNLIIAEVIDGLTTQELNRKFVEQGIVLDHLVMKRSNLEEQFLAILKENDA